MVSSGGGWPKRGLLYGGWGGGRCLQATIKTQVCKNISRMVAHAGPSIYNFICTRVLDPRIDSGRQHGTSSHKGSVSVNLSPAQRHGSSINPRSHTLSRTLALNSPSHTLFHKKNSKHCDLHHPWWPAARPCTCWVECIMHLEWPAPWPQPGAI